MRVIHLGLFFLLLFVLTEESFGQAYPGYQDFFERFYIELNGILDSDNNISDRDAYRIAAQDRFADGATVDMGALDDPRAEGGGTGIVTSKEYLKGLSLAYNDDNIKFSAEVVRVNTRTVTGGSLVADVEVKHKVVDKPAINVLYVLDIRSYTAQAVRARILSIAEIQVKKTNPATEADAKIRQLESEESAKAAAAERVADDNAWSKAKRVNSESSYRGYMRSFPGGVYVVEARRALTDLEAEAALASTPSDRATTEIASQMVRIPSGSFTMGCTSEQGSDCDDDERPAHEVSVGAFQLSKYEVTQKQWQAIMGNNPSYNAGCDRCPVEKVSWDDAQEFIKKLNQLTGQRYRLPTEAEWEYAARGGQGYRYSGSGSMGSVGWYRDNSGGKTRPVGGKSSNGYGLQDMSGNVWEWCSGYPVSSDVKDYTGVNPVARGGGWGDSAQYCRVSDRRNYAPSLRDSYVGFRLAR